MNDDDMRGLLERSLREGGMDGVPGPDEDSIAGRIRGARRRRAAGRAVAGAASIALVAVIVWQVGGFSTDPNPPATPTTTEPSDLPSETSSDEPSETDEPTNEPTGGEQTDPARWSEAIFPECGDTFAGLPEQTSQLVAMRGPSETLAAGGGQWLTEIENTGATTIQGDVAWAQTVVVDEAGTVVATVDDPASDDFMWAAEGVSHLAIAPGETLPFRINESWTCAGGAEGSEPLGTGEYEMYVILNIGDAGASQSTVTGQAQGGPFPLVIDSSIEQPGLELPVPEGAATWEVECGDAWTVPAVETGFELELLDDIRLRRPLTDDIDGGSRLTVTQPVAGTLYNDVVLLQDGRVVTPGFAGDSQSEYFVSAGSELDLSFSSSFDGCDGQTLPPGEYQAVVVTILHQWSAGADDGMVTSVVAITDPVALVLE